MTDKRPLVTIHRMRPATVPVEKIPGLVAWFDIEVAEVLMIYGCALVNSPVGWKVRCPKSDQRDVGRPGGRHVHFASGQARHHIAKVAVDAWKAIQ